MTAATGRGVTFLRPRVLKLSWRHKTAGSRGEHGTASRPSLSGEGMSAATAGSGEREPESSCWPSLFVHAPTTAQGKAEKVSPLKCTE